MFKQGPLSGQDNYRLISVFISVGFPLYLTIDILPNKAKYHLETVLLGNHACYIYFGTANLGIKNLTCVHDELTIAYNGILKHPEKAPDWLTDGLT